MASAASSQSAASAPRTPHRLAVVRPTAGPAPVAASAPILLRAVNLQKSYRKGNVAVPVLRGTDLEIAEGQFTAIIGQSGSGKSTLLHVLGTLDAPDSGEVHYQQRRIDNLPARAKDQLRNAVFGMIFQFYHLLPELTALENVLLPAMIDSGVIGYWRQRRTLQDRARELLHQVGLSHRLKHRPRELSGGEMQRVALARSLMSQPRLLLADEPTGNLDSRTGAEIMSLLRSLNVSHQLTIVMVTHDLSVAAQADRTVRLTEGRIDHERG